MFCNDVKQLEWDKEKSTLLCKFSIQGDGILLRSQNSKSDMEFSVGVKQGTLFITHKEIFLDIEDTYGVAMGHGHELVLTFGIFGTRVYLDGYQIFSSATDLRPTYDAVIIANQTRNIRIDSLQALSQVASSQEICDQYIVPKADIDFAAAYLSTADVKRVSHLRDGTIYTQFRVRGLGQYGTIIAASRGEQEIINLSIDKEGILYKAFVDGCWNEYRAHGFWGEGHFHDVVIRAFRGAIDIYIDGSLVTHQPGQYLFDAVGGIDHFSIGEDTHGIRLFGEVRSGGIYSYALSDGQIAALSHCEPLTTTAIFDKGYEGAASYRIPSMVTTNSDVIIAGADQRVVISNDAPNKINFVIRRSLDGGDTWGPLQTVIAYPDKGIPNMDGASFTDSCMVVDRITGRVIVLIDHFPGGVDFANAVQHRGTDNQGRLVLTDRNGNVYYLNDDGTVEGDLDNAQNSLDASLYRVSEDGYVCYNGNPGGNIFFKEGVDENETLLAVRTSYLVEVHSDDDGATWSKPRYVDWMVREEWMGFLGISPGNGVQLSKGEYAGRLLVPFYCCSQDPQYYASGALISDDGGTTWRRGQCINEAKIVNGEEIDITAIDDNDATTHESVFVEDASGDVIVFFRNRHRSGRVGKAVSHDGGQTWDEVEFDSQIPDIFSQPNAITLPDNRGWRYGEASDRVIFANACLMRPYRGCGTLRYSEDGGRTWEKTRCFNPYHYVYQCMSIRPDGDIGLLWERETAGVYYTHVTRSWLGIE